MSQELPKISIVIPTKNSSTTLPLCLKSIQMQNYPRDRIEVIIVDAHSTDATRQIAKAYGCKVITSNKAPLGARYDGLKVAGGDIILLLDSDHILRRRTILIEITHLLYNKYDMLHLHEITFRPRTLIQKLIAIDKETMQRISKRFDPLRGVLYPRAFKRELLLEAFQNIPGDALERVHEHEDVILHYECLQLSERIGSLSKALYHIDSERASEFFAKVSKYGSMDAGAKALKKYTYAIKLKQMFRLIEIPYLLLEPVNGLKVLLLIVLRVLAYLRGKIAPARFNNV